MAREAAASKSRRIEMYRNLEDGAMDEIDAALFTGDMFLNKDNIESFRRYLDRWSRQLDAMEIHSKE